MGERLEKIKDHFRRNEDRYACLALGVAIGGIITAILVKKNATAQVVVKIEGLGNAASAMVGDGNKLYQRISVYGNVLGRPGIPVIDTTTGKRFESMTLAAESIGVSVSNLSKQLAGTTEHLNGHRFELAA